MLEDAKRFWKHLADIAPEVVARDARIAELEGALETVLVRTFASRRKVAAGLRHVATTDFQDYPEGTIEVGTALDAIDMVVKDVISCLPAEVDLPENLIDEVLILFGHDPQKVGKRMKAVAEEALKRARAVLEKSE